MKCTFSELKNKEVINTAAGTRIGYADDMEIDVQSGKLLSLIIYGRPKLMGIMGHDDDIIIDCKDIIMIGDDTVLVSLNEDDLCKGNKSDSELSLD